MVQHPGIPERAFKIYAPETVSYLADESALEDQLLRDAGLSASEYAVLVTLSYAPDGVLRARDLCSQLAWDGSRLSHLVARAERRGLVTREKCSEDA